MGSPLKKNDLITIEIDGMTSEGAGVGRVDGFAVFIPGALKGEKVTAHIIKAAGSYAVGKLEQVLNGSRDRVSPPCPLFPKCGGCGLQHMDQSAQLEYKRELVRDALKRIGGFTDVDVAPVIGMDEPFRYRNKAGFPFGFENGKVVWGLYAARTHRLIPASDCLIENETAVRAANAVCRWANECGISVYNEQTHKGVLRHIVCRACTDGAAVCIVTTGKLPFEKKLVEMILLDVPSVVSIVHNVNTKDTNVICGPEYRLIWGKDSVEHTIMDLRFSVSAESFLQVNSVQTEKLYSLALEGLELTGDETVADVFCGIGTITLQLAKRTKSVIGIEYVERAVEDAKKNAEINGIDNARFYAGPAEKLLPRLVDAGERFDCVVLDPPRKGADPAVLSAIAESGAEQIAYVSCDPATLARDLKLLCEYGYSIVSVQPVDMFPQTCHVETVVLMSRVRD